METACADSSFVVSLLTADRHHALAMRAMAEDPAELIFTPLHRIEVRNMLRTSHARGDIQVTERDAAFRQLEADLDDGPLSHQPVSWTEVFRRADDLSQRYAQQEGQRTLDLLHVASAVELREKRFLTFDQRQRRLAVAVGLIVGP